MPHSPQAQQMLDYARGDATALRTLGADPDIPDRIVGFHAQQSVEKAMKSVMLSRRVKPPRIHDLGRLTQMLVPPIEHDMVIALTRYAADERYPSGMVEPLDRGAAQAAVDEVLTWAAQLVHRDV
jgi:HEPN domain-containing protein